MAVVLSQTTLAIPRITRFTTTAGVAPSAALSALALARGETITKPSTCALSWTTRPGSAAPFARASTSNTPASRSAAAISIARTRGGTNGLVMSGTSRPTSPVRPVATLRAARLG